MAEGGESPAISLPIVIICIKTIHFIYKLEILTVATVRDHSRGVNAMLVTYIVLAVSGLIGSAIAVDDVKAATRHD